MIVRDYKVYYRTSGAFTRQLRKAESAVAATPTDVDARLILGYLYAGLGYADEAVSQLQEVKRHAEPDSTAAQLVERLLQEVERGEAGGGEAGGGRAWDEHARDGGELPPPPAKDDGADTSDAKSRRKRIF